jgi:hypothetical protein
MFHLVDSGYLPTFAGEKMGCGIKDEDIMDKITITMSRREYKKFLAYKEADKIARRVRRGIIEAKEADEGKRKLKSAYNLANEL